ncbi:MAG: proline--tRNA ligase [Mycoplasmoidaceae bacterium]
MANKKIIQKEHDFAKWYTSVIHEADLVDYGLVKGTIIFKPYAWAIWNKIQKILDAYFWDLEIQNCYMPALIPYSDFIKEAQHVEGFAPELFKVSEIGNKKLSDPLVLRPTSEIMFCHYFAKNIMSYNDLPLILNQWANAFRVEKNTKPFLRNSEFLWQEQHGAFASEKDARRFAKRMIELYQNFVEKYLCIPVLVGEKTAYERFAGSQNTYTIEAIMQDGQALQCGTSHYLGQNFSKNFQIKFQNQDNQQAYVYQTSAGVSTRLIGGIIMAHADNNGLVLPPKIAPIQVKLNTIFADKDLNVLKTAKKLYLALKDEFNVEIDNSHKSIGFKLADGEVKGIPIQINIGPNDLKEGFLTYVCRNSYQKASIKLSKLSCKFIRTQLDRISSELYQKAFKNLHDRIVVVDSLEAFQINISHGKIVLAYWDGDQNEEKKLKDLTGASSRCIKEEVAGSSEGVCFYTKRKTKNQVYFARAY